LAHRLDWDPDPDLCSCSNGGVQVKRPSKLKSALLHHPDTEVSVARPALLWSLEASAIIVDREVQGVTLIFELNLYATRLSMANGIGHCFLPNANQVMHTVRSQQGFGTLNMQCSGN
jgi:hypothetical protein